MSKISLAAARTNAKLTQAQVAEKTRTSVTTISNWETGVAKPSWTDFVFLCNLYGFSEDDIFFDSDTTK